MKVDLTITISVILGISAILAPIATALINNFHESRTKRKEYIENVKKQAVLNLITSSYNDVDEKDFYKNINLLLLTFGMKYSKDLTQIIKCYENDGSNKTICKLNNELLTILEDDNCFK